MATQSSGLPSPEQYYGSQDIQDLQTKANEASTLSGQYAAAAPTLADKLKSAIQEKLNYNQDIIAEQSKAMGNYFAAPSKAREQYQDIFNPFQREALVAQATSNAYAPYATLSNVLQQRQGSIADAINAASGAFQGASTAQANTATQAMNAYQQALNLAGIKYGGAQWAYEQTHAKPSTAQPQSPLEKMIEEEILRMFNENKGDNKENANAPQYTPQKGEGATDGQWVYHQGKWMINTEAQANNSSNSSDTWDRIS